MSGLSLSSAMSLSLSSRTGGGGATAVITAPVLTKTSSSGVNPMSWSAVYTDLAVDDVLRLSWTKNGGAATTETHAVTSDDLILASEGDYSFSWPAFVTASAAFINGDVITVKERIERGGSNSAYSNILTDTVVISVTPAWTNIATATPQTNSSTTHTFTSVTFGAGKAVCLLRCGQSPSVAMVPSGGGATTNFTSVAAGDGIQVFQANGVAGGNYDITITTTGAETPVSLIVATGTNLANTVSDTSIYAGGYPGNDISGSSTLIVPAGGLGIATAWVLNNNSGTWLNSGVEIGEIADAGNVLTQSAATYTGTNTPTWQLPGGSNYSSLAAAAWAAV